MAMASTFELRAELDAAGVSLPGEDKLTEISEAFNERLEALRIHLGAKTEGPVTWFTLFKEVDEDGSGFITLDELLDVVRSKLSLKKSELSDSAVKALFVALDTDNSDVIQRDEFKRFIRLGAPASKDDGSRFHSLAGNSNMGGTFEAYKSSNEALVGTTPTRVIRAELEAEDQALPGDAELNELSKAFHEGLESYRISWGAKTEHTLSWYQIFKDIDEDGNGAITYDELEDAVRDKLKVKKADLTDMQLKALWCVLDDDDSDAVRADELTRFLKRYTPPKKQKVFGGQDFQNTHALGTFSALEAEAALRPDEMPTTAMRAELEAAGEPLPDDEQLEALAKVFHEGLAAARVIGTDRSEGGMTWYQLFKAVDEDGSGLITYDELRDAVRKVLKVGKNELPDLGLKALWCFLDIDDSDSVQFLELTTFLKRYTPEKPASHFGGTKAANENRGGTFGAFLSNNEANFVTPTKGMRSELESAGELLPGDAELDNLAKSFHQGLQAYRIKLGTEKYEGGMTWFQLFNAVDEDGSGSITYDELDMVVRKRLELKKAMLPELKLKGLWCVLDADDSNAIMADELTRFLKRYTPPKRSATFGGKVLNKGGFIAKYASASALEQSPTQVMRSELEAGGVEVPGEEELNVLSRIFHSGLEKSRNIGTKHANGVMTMYSLFKEADKDGSGAITYDELYHVVRKKLELNRNQLSSERIKALWCVLDADSSGSIYFDELARFLRRYTPPKKTKPKFGGQFQSVRGQAFGAIIRRGTALAVTPTSEMRAGLEEVAVELPDEEAIVALSSIFNKRLEDFHYTRSRETTANGREPTSWYNLFREADEDDSGFITFDELEDVTRKKLRVRRAELTDQSLKALWCVLDADDSNAIEQEEFKLFLTGQAAELLEQGRERAKPPTDLAHTRLQKRRAAMTPRSPYTRPAFDLDAYVRKETAAHEQRLQALDARLQAQSEKRHKQTKLLAKQVGSLLYKSEQRRECLGTMQRDMLRSPIPDDADREIIRIGSTRIVPLYQSERLVKELERMQSPTEEEDDGTRPRSQGGRWSPTRSNSPSRGSPSPPISPLSPVRRSKSPPLSPMTNASTRSQTLTPISPMTTTTMRSSASVPSLFATSESYVRADANLMERAAKAGVAERLKRITNSLIAATKDHSGTPDQIRAAKKHLKAIQTANLQLVERAEKSMPKSASPRAMLVWDW